MPVENLDALTPETRALAEKYLRDVDRVLRSLDPEVADATGEDLLGHVCAVLDSTATPEDAAQLVRELGAPSTFAEAASSRADADNTEPAGRVLGIPYDFRVTPGRIASRWWNPADSRVLMPRIFGIGWDLNFGAIAVRLHLIEPDAEDEPFATVSDRAFLVALLVPVSLSAFLVGSFLGALSVLPATLPTHWNVVGVPDSYSSRGVAFGLLFAMSLVPTLWAVWSVATHRPALSRGAVIGLAAFFSALSAGVWALTLATVLAPPVGPAMAPLSILPAFLVPLAVFVGLARSGRAADQRRDFQVSSGR